MARIAINGFGRIGRLAFRYVGDKDIERDQRRIWGVGNSATNTRKGNA